MLMAKLAQRLGISRYRADEHYQTGLAAFVSRDLALSIRELRTAVALLPRHAEFHSALGFALLDDKQQRPAAESFERALSLNSFEMLANYGQGLIAYRAKNWNEAWKYFNAAHVARPKRAETLYCLAMVSHRLGNNAEALACMESAKLGFAKSGDRREAHCDAWQREFQQLLKS